ncbi:MAG: fatty acid desaturase [Planctomycetes bacterium]|nr:fatty acid desaturase [Planctomycetota bacterium]
MNTTLLRTPTLAWPTLLLGLCVPLAWLAVVIGAMTHQLPLWLAAPLALGLAYVSFTPMHDASHRSLGRRGWLNEAFGRLAGLPLLAPFPAFRAMHLAHHKHTNEEGDPDLWSGSGPSLLLPLRWLTQDLHYYVLVLTGRVRLSRRETLEVALGVSAQIVAGGIFVAQGEGLTFLLVVLVPARIATALLAFAFDYLPHRPHQITSKEDRFLATHIMAEPWLSPIMLCQNFHLVHHLYPAVPFYRYGTVWRDQREALLAKGAREVSILDRTG